MSTYQLAVGDKLFCTSCQINKIKEGGKNVVTRNGLQRRWKCADCIERSRVRLAQHKKVA